jgi:hypothetical protein
MRQLLIITGTMGAGKTTVLGEAADILTLRHVAHAAIDVDSLGLAHLPSAISNDSVMYDNLRSVCENYAALGVGRFLLARALENRVQLELCRDVVSGTDTVVCRLTASVEAMQRRVQMRESGVLQREYVARVSELNVLLDYAKLEDFIVVNENRPLTDVALEVLVKAGWISN